MTLNEILVQAVREAQTAAQNAANAYAKLDRRFLNEAGLQDAAQRLAAPAIQTAEAAKARGFAAIDEACAQLDNAEQEQAAARAVDTGYLYRLEAKMRLLDAVDVKRQTDATLKALFAEYANDPVALAMIEARVGSMRAVNVAPADNRGKLQKHLQDVVKSGFERCINKCVEGEALSPHNLGTGAIFGRASEIDAFCDYCGRQDAYFSIDDVSIWEQVRQQGRSTGETGTFNMNFKGVREH